MKQSDWLNCIDRLAEQVSEQDMQTYVHSLQVEIGGNELRLFAPNRYIADWVNENIHGLILSYIETELNNHTFQVIVQVGGAESALIESKAQKKKNKTNPFEVEVSSHSASFTFANFVEGNSNELGLAAASQVAQNPGGSRIYNPLYIYGSSGLGKTHLMYAVYNRILADNPKAKVALINSNQYLHHMVFAIKNQSMEAFKKYYNSLDALLMDDVQFLASKERTQEEFFHTFNTLIEQGKQIVLTCDRYPDEINNLEARLRSRFGAGLPVQINPPELETRVGILIAKAEHMGWDLPEETAFFIAKHIQSNVRLLEGALSRLVAVAGLKNAELSIELAKDTLRDVLQLREKRISIENIQRTVAEYYKLKLADLLAKTRTRSIARPRQMAMCLAKELTTLSLPEIGREFGGRDHTTVLHACKTIHKLRQSDNVINNDYDAIMRTLQA